MKIIELKAKSSVKVFRGERELGESDVEEIPKGLIPGEWCILKDSKEKRLYLCYINAYADIFFKIKILSQISSTFDPRQDEKEVASHYLKNQLLKVQKSRARFSGYESGARLVYGANDGIIGLIVDMYQKYILIQINTAGLDRFRDIIKSELQNAYPEKKVIFFDNEEYRKSEVLPVHSKEKIESGLEVLENDLKYIILESSIQKIGYYYDHRENRARLLNLLSRYNGPKGLGLDLFCYAGSWGLHLLKAGVSKVDFVDQSDVSKIVDHNLEANGFQDRGSFKRSDVFKFLDEAYSNKMNYDVIVSDPPAFTKSEKNKNQAILGYEKLHGKALKLLASQGIFVAASCTHYVSFEELDKTVHEASTRNGQQIQLLDMGLQGFDHPIKNLKDKSFYIKYLVYFVTRGQHE